jgi:ABC-type antimicrobial peptide transport system permease subunit
VVGVARDIKLDRLDEAPQPLFYLSHHQARQRADNVMLVARGSATPTQIAADLRRVVREVDRNLVVMATSTLEEQFATMLFPFRAAAGLLAAFGVLALAVAAIGLYGAVSFTVSRRTREVGIRMSLGADAVAVIRTMVSGVLTVVMVGVIVGIAAAFLVAQFLRNFLIGVAPSDPITLVGVSVLLCCVALVAALVPARRASRVSPVNALRYE